MISQQGVQKLQKRGTDSKVPRFFVSIIFIVFSGVVSPIFAKKQSKTTLATRQCEAQMVDMPLPVGGVLVPAVTQVGDTEYGTIVGGKNVRESAVSGGTTRSDAVILTYRVTTTRDALVQFYEGEMMRLGWNKLAHSSGDEELLIFESPSKMAIIQMRPEKPKKGWKRTKKIILTLHKTSKENQIYN